MNSTNEKSASLTGAALTNEYQQGKGTNLDVINPRFDHEFLADPVGEAIAKAANDGRLLIRKTGNKCLDDAKMREAPAQICGSLAYKGELTILFADTGVGKSILAVQMADNVSRGKGTATVLKNEAGPLVTLFVDFELSDKQFENRCSQNFTNHYRFHENFYRVELNPEAELPVGFASFEDHLVHSLEVEIQETGAEFIIIDNITYLSNETEKAKDALPLMKKLNAIKKKYGVAILALAHTPKRDSSRPITVNDLSGSKMLSNFADAIFAIGQSSIDKSIRYIKQLKTRNGEKDYDADNVILCNVVKPTNFLHYEFLSFANESEHLRIIEERERNEVDEQVRAILDIEPEISAYAIAKKLHTGDEHQFQSFKVKITRIVNRLKAAA
ncbi:AAA family ATPase [Flaviaesturariibacter amylovorans]|uniref:AAA family ATPase n=1 Tax=Flaviaesturariibacter amylovorans TaxID=1084520 RepID=A0ABP8GPF7_9BACT